MKIEDAVIGMEVAYIPYKDCPKDEIEFGVITSKNQKYIFVRFWNDNYSKSVHPKYLDYR